MKYITIIFISLVTIAGTCKKESATCHTKVSFINKSQNSIFVDWNAYYPDTTLGNGFYNPSSQPHIYEVSPSETNTQALTARNDCLESRFKTQITSGIMMIYVFDKTTLQTVPWDTVKARKLYLKRYDLSLQDLQNKDWTITYP